MSARYLRYDISFDSLEEEIVFTITRLISDEHGAPFLPAFEEKLTEFEELQKNHRQLRLRVIRARAMLELWDDRLDLLVDDLNEALLKLTGRNRDAPLWQFYFGKKPPSALKRPILGSQLETARGFIPSLTGDNAPDALKAIGARLIDLVAGADEAIKEHSLAKEALREFISIGPFKRFIDSLNQLRIDTFGALNKLPLENPGLNLPHNFAKRFFIRGSSSYEAQPELEEEIARVKEELEAKKEDVAVLEARLTELLARKEAKDREQSERERKLAEIEAAKQRIAELEAELTKLR